ncbi:hypothetical protein GN157_04850 [Flavobacterium rakeshii]|uniref:Uncharacterized protein n=1 Tax=Flavobacterium rakeshii TaxID=1038845 RepID=A0A6N8H955_9FLAO|nr:hypothetical protein [Flavobacterium rakeshii]MUV03031.1 hypothetical protein [Flavobacterium rakeshii]
MSATNPYETSGTYSSASRSFNLDFHITKEDPLNKYHFYQKFDISQTIIDENGDQKFLSAILVFMKKKTDNGGTLLTNLADHNLLVNNSDLIPYSSETFDYDAEDALIVLFHDNTFNSSYPGYFHGKANMLYNDMKKNGLTYSRHQAPDLNPLFIPKSNIPNLIDETPDEDGLPFIRPRTAGLTIIKRSLRP